MNNRKIDSVNPDHLNNEEEFMDIQTGSIMSKSEFIAKINNGKYPGYYVSSNFNSDLTDDASKN